MPKEAQMTFTTWVRAQDAFGQFDVRKGDDLREGVSLVKDYPEHLGQSGRPGKPFVNLGIAAEDGDYKGFKKDELIAEINRRNEFVVVAADAIDIPAKATVKQLVDLLEAHDAAGAEQAEAAREAAGIPEPDVDESSDDTETPGTESGSTTTETGAPGQDQE